VATESTGVTMARGALARPVDATIVVDGAEVTRISLHKESMR